MPTIYKHLALLETAEPAALEDLLASGLKSFVVRQLAPTTVVVDHERLADLRKLLKRLGQTPRITTE
jgi:hypothetical protein